MEILQSCTTPSIYSLQWRHMRNMASHIIPNLLLFQQLIRANVKRNSKSVHSESVDSLHRGLVMLKSFPWLDGILWNNHRNCKWSPDSTTVHCNKPIKLKGMTQTLNAYLEISTDQALRHLAKEIEGFHHLSVVLKWKSPWGLRLVATWWNGR